MRTESGKFGGFDGNLFANRQSPLRESNGLRTELLRANPLFDVEIASGLDLLIWDESVFGRVNVAKGLIRILAQDEATLIKEGQRRYQAPPDTKAPTIQKLLTLAYELRERLEENPNLTRGALAKGIGMNPSYLTRVLHLLGLDPEIQRYIMDMKPGIYPGPITENRIRFLARNPDHDYQVAEFRLMKGLKPRARYRLHVSVPEPVPT